jgi:hypothetical protein
MALTKIPSSSSLVDQQFIQVSGPDGLLFGYQYDLQQKTLFAKESQVIYPSFHGSTHIAEDPIPAATCDTNGLMAADDKCKLDSLTQTRVGVLGFLGAGFPDDGGWMSGDIILAAGTEFISLERVGNVVRFTVDSPIPLTCACESCQQIFWVQDETDISSIRPPTCSGKLPGINGYGELKIYAFPDTSLVDPNDTASTLANKGDYPSLIFKRYDDAIAPGTAEFDLVLKRDSLNNTQTEIGWAFTPGAGGTTQCVWFTGKDTDGNQIRYDLDPVAEPELVGHILYKGHLLTSKTAVITDYTSAILSTNQYTCKWWDVDGSKVIGDSFTAKNVWEYNNPEGGFSGTNPKALVLDSTVDVLPIGTMVQILFFKVGDVSGEPIRRYYFNKKPTLNPQHIWGWNGAVQFGDMMLSREEVAAGAGSEDATAYSLISTYKGFEHTIWGITGSDDPLLMYDVFSTGGTAAADVNTQHRAIIDSSIPALKVIGGVTDSQYFSDRPVYLWNRNEFINNYTIFDIGKPDSSNFSPIDILFRSVIDANESKYVRVVEKGYVNGMYFIRVKGLNFTDLPKFGDLRTIYPASEENIIFKYTRKFMFPTAPTGVTDDSKDYLDSIALANDTTPYAGEVGDVLELLHTEYNNPCLRLEFTVDDVTGLISLQFKVGTLDMSVKYEEDIADDVDDYVRGLSDYTVSAVYSQSGSFTGVGTKPVASPDNFTVYDGGIQTGGTLNEYWNRLILMVRDDQLWVWWNGLLIPPSSSLSAALSTPISVSTPYFPITNDVDKPFGKIGMRLWPGSIVRRVEIYSQNTTYNEYAYGQIQLV